MVFIALSKMRRYGNLCSLWLLVKEPHFRVPSQYLWEIVSERPFTLGCTQRKVMACAEPPPVKLPKKACTRKSKW